MATSFTLLKSTFCWVATFLKKMSVPIPLFYRHVWLLKPSHVLCKTFCSLQFLLLGLRRWEVVCSPTLPPPPPTPLLSEGGLPAAYWSPLPAGGPAFALELGLPAPASAPSHLCTPLRWGQQSSRDNRFPVLWLCFPTEQPSFPVKLPHRPLGTSPEKGSPAATPVSRWEGLSCGM